MQFSKMLFHLLCTAYAFSWIHFPCFWGTSPFQILSRETDFWNGEVRTVVNHSLFLKNNNNKKVLAKQLKKVSELWKCTIATE
jgi:hypothetical protein